MASDLRSHCFGSRFVSFSIVLLVGTRILSAEEPLRIRVGYLPATHDALLFIAYENRHFRDFGLDVELRRFNNSAEALQHLAAGDIDVAIPGISAPARYIGSGAPFTIVGGAAMKSAALVVTGARYEEFKGTSIDERLMKLVNKRVGTVVQSTGDSILRARLAEMQILDKVIIATRNSPAEIMSDLETGNLDAGVLWSPHMTRAINERQMRILLWMD